jgi:hypothetical protein
MQGEWGLASWYPNHVKKAKKDVVSLSPKTFEADASDEEDPDVDAVYEAAREARSLA